MASDNTISESLPHASTPESDNTIPELLARTSISRSDETVFELMPRTSTTRSGKTYGFFQTLPLEEMNSLPQEIRDKIYDLLFQEKEKVVSGWHYKIRTILPKARLISRQLTKEYDERPPINYLIEASVCELAKFDCPCTDGPNWYPSSPAARRTDLHINLIVCQSGRYRKTHCLDPGFRAQKILREWYGPWLEALLEHLPFLGKVTMSISCSSLQCAMTLQSFSEGNWLNVPNLSRMTLLSPTDDDECDPEWWVEEHRKNDAVPSHSAEFFESREAMATWTPAHGWQMDAQATERCRREEANYWFARS
jgi:hypothetical protein